MQVSLSQHSEPPYDACAPPKGGSGGGMYLATTTWLVFKLGHNISFNENTAAVAGNSIFSQGTPLTWSGLCPKVTAYLLVRCMHVCKSLACTHCHKRWECLPLPDSVAVGAVQPYLGQLGVHTAAQL